MYGSSINFRTRYYEIKSRTFAKLGSHPNFSTDLLYNHPANGKPQACALHKAVQFDKGSEKARQSGAVRKPQLVEWIEENLK